MAYKISTGLYRDLALGKKLQVLLPVRATAGKVRLGNR